MESDPTVPEGLDFHLALNVKLTIRSMIEDTQSIWISPVKVQDWTVPPYEHASASI